MHSSLPDNNQIIFYNDGEIELKVSIEDESVWLSRHQISELFDRDVKTIGKHINNIFKEEELMKTSTVAKFATVQDEGGRDVVRDIEYYNLDVIISIGYRVKSQKGVRFRQWATNILKQYIFNGYSINSEKITHQRFKELENEVTKLREHVNKIDGLIVSKQIKIKQGVFYNGQIFDAYIFVNDLLKSAKKEVVLIDNYIDDTILILFSKYSNINFTIATKSISKQLKLDIEKYNAQYKNLQIKTTKNFHDRFLIIDNEAYHISASLKDLGKKIFAFSKIDIKLLGKELEQ